ncbi:MAG: cryptochrome/photolyase family protein [Rhodospirillales bacterium]|nr:cryptochrome/photolyase family protein [Rhodospirillales bacterium]
MTSVPTVATQANGNGAACLRVVLGDQLSRSVSALRDIDPERDIVLMAEVMDECTYVSHHPKKIALILSAMRHFADDLRRDGVRVDYRRLDAPGNTGSFRGEVQAAVGRHRPERVVATEPGEWRVRDDMAGWQAACGAPVDIRDDDRFVCSLADFRAWAEGRRTLRMEYFYRDMRRRTGLLMDDVGEPAGGRWNFDAENRRALPTGVEPPEPLRFAPDAVTREVLALVATRFGNHFGELKEFWFATTSEQANAAFEAFLETALPSFGDYQDAMKEGAKTLYHAVVSPYLNAGLLDPLDLCRRVEQAYRDGRAPLNAAEGFIRQILGWREYVRGIYWLKMPAYAETNALSATRALPGFYWTGETDMNCLRQCIGQTREEAYAHHIQRLMVTGNFALVAGIAPAEVCEWYLCVYADAYEWVELPNTHGMALFADGGVIGSKPYASSGKYIDRMSDYCKRCRYDVRKSTGPDACPFNFLYWDFIARNRDALSRNQRMTMIYRSMARMQHDKIQAMRAQARTFLESLSSDY